MTVVVIEDDVVVADTLALYLQQAGLTVTVAADGLTKDADQYGYGDDHDDYENEQRDYGDGHEISPSREWCIDAAGSYPRRRPPYYPTTVSSVTTARYGLWPSLVS